MDMMEEFITPHTKKVFVVDSMMGNGKTTAILKSVPLLLGQRFIYIVEYLSEVDRVKKELAKHGVRVKSPERYGVKGKSNTIKELLANGINIVMTHALLDKLDSVALEMIKCQGYVVIMDEVHKIIERYQITRKDWDLLINQNLISVDTSDNVRTRGQITWLDKDYRGKFEDFKNLATLGNIFLYSENIYMWTFPVELFSKASKVFLLTYLFDGSLMKSYFDYFDVKYTKLHVLNGDFVAWTKEHQDNDIRAIRDKINIYEGNLNFEDKSFSLSSSYFTKAPQEEIKVIKNNLYNYFRNISQSKAKDNMWTCVKSMKGRLQGGGYTKGHISLTMRATNEYRYKKNLAYVYNRYLNPIDKKFFENRNIEVDEDMYAVSEILQWIFRSQIRDGKEIEIYIPSYRMRELLRDFLYFDC